MFGLFLALALAQDPLTAGQSPARVQLVERAVFDTVADSSGLAYPLTAATSATMNASNHLFLVQGMNSEVVEVAPDGRLVTRFGQSGKGPGEFQSPSAIGWSGDRLWVADSQLGKVTLFEANGKLIDDFNTQLPPWFALEGRFVPWFLATPGRNVIGRSSVAVDQVEAGLDSLPLLKADFESGAVDTMMMVAIPAVMSIPHPTNPNGVLQGGQPVRAEMRFAISKAGDTLFVAWDDFGSKRIHVRAIDVASGKFTEYRIEYQYRNITGAIRDSIIDAHAAELEALFGSRARAAASLRDATTWPRYLPAVAGILVNDDDIWLDHGLFHGRRDYLVIHRSSRTVSRASIPRGQLMAVHGNRAWGIYYDDLDVPHLIFYGLQEGS